ncbi:hypothetical protein ACN28S_34780 [Cystobacter fuscus]
MNSKKNAFGMFAVVMGLGPAILSGCEANEPRPTDKLQVKPSTAGVKVTESLASNHPDFKLAQMSVLLDGTLRSMDSLSEIQGQLSIIVDEESLKTGVARAYRTTEEFDAYVEKQDKQCASADVSAMDTTSQCVFYDTFGCSGWTRRLAINCGYAAGNLELDAGCFLRSGLWHDLRLPQHRLFGHLLVREWCRGHVRQHHQWHGAVRWLRQLLAGCRKPGPSRLQQGAARFFDEAASVVRGLESGFSDMTGG